MNELKAFQELSKLKAVERLTKVKDRSESAAEHTWSCMVFATYFAKKTKDQINENKVMKLLLYHDIVEIKTGDIPELDWEGRQDKEKNERKAFEQFKDQLPKELYDEYSECFEEFEAAETLEAKFAQAIDKLEPMIHQLDHKCDWRKYGYTQEVLWDKKGKYMEPFPALMNFYQKFIKHLMNNDYID